MRSSHTGARLLPYLPILAGLFAIAAGLGGCTPATSSKEQSAREFPESPGEQTHADAQPNWEPAVEEVVWTSVGEYLCGHFAASSNRIEPGDMLILVCPAENLLQSAYQVREGLVLDLPYIGELSVLGKRGWRVSQTIRRKMLRVMRYASFELYHVPCVQRTPHVLAIGDVEEPGPLPITQQDIQLRLESLSHSPRPRILDGRYLEGAVLLAGGEEARYVCLMRVPLLWSGKRATILFWSRPAELGAEAFIRGECPEAALPLEDGDVLVVLQRAPDNSSRALIESYARGQLDPMMLAQELKRALHVAER